MIECPFCSRGRGLALRERRRTFAAPVRLTGGDKRPSDVAAMRRVFERYCAAGEEAGFAASAPPHPGLMDVQARSISHWSPYDRVGVVNAVS